jgi:hypothetical protein
MVTEKELANLLKENPPAKRFVPYCHINKQSDTMTVYFEGDADYSKRLNDHITLYLALETDEIIGCRIKGISGILDDLPNYITGKHNGVSLSIILFAFRGGANDDESRQLKDLAKVASERQMVLEPSA